MYGIPLGVPFHTVPKSACKPREPQEAMSCADAASTGAVETSAFQGLSAGNGRRPARLAFAPALTLEASDPDTSLVEHEAPPTIMPQSSRAARGHRRVIQRARRERRWMCILDGG